jgi:DNA ligase-1
MKGSFCMLAHKYEPDRIKRWPVAVEPKLDGVRVLAFMDAVGVDFVSRSNKRFPALEHMSHELAKFHGDVHQTQVVLDCEVVSGTFKDTVSSVRRKSVKAEDATLYVFDIFEKAAFDNNCIAGTYLERRKEVGAFVKAANRAGLKFVKVLPGYTANSVAEVASLYASFRELGYEGAMVKQLDGLYERKRSHAWMKIKAEESEDLPIVGAFEGEGKYVGMLGGIIVDRKGVEVRVGTGITDQQRMDMWVAHKFGKLKGRIVEVGYHETTPDGSLRHPRFIRFRDALTGAKE